MMTYLLRVYSKEGITAGVLKSVSAETEWKFKDVDELMVVLKRLFVSNDLEDSTNSGN